MRKKISVITVCYCLSLAQPHAAFASWTETSFRCDSDSDCYGYIDCNAGESQCLQCNTDGRCEVKDSEWCDRCTISSGGCGDSDTYGCTADPNLPNSCYGKSATTLNGKRVYYMSSDVDRDEVNTYLDIYKNPSEEHYNIMYSDWNTDFPGYSKFCYCATEECDGNVSVYPVRFSGNDSDCIDGYHWESNKGCVVDKTCSSDCSSIWMASGAGYQSYENRHCSKVTGNCVTDGTSYRCAAGYYGSSSNGTSGCTRCPDLNGVYGSSTAGSKYITSCYIPSNTVMSDATGSMVFTNNCYYPSGTVGS